MLVRRSWEVGLLDAKVSLLTGIQQLVSGCRQPKGLRDDVLWSQRHWPKNSKGQGD
jgi:hypothetical protein